MQLFKNVGRSASVEYRNVPCSPREQEGRQPACAATGHTGRLLEVHHLVCVLRSRDSLEENSAAFGNRVRNAFCVATHSCISQ